MKSNLENTRRQRSKFSLNVIQFLTKITTVESEVALNHCILHGLNFLPVIFVANIICSQHVFLWGDMHWGRADTLGSSYTST